MVSPMVWHAVNPLALDPPFRGRDAAGRGHARGWRRGADLQRTAAQGQRRGVGVAAERRAHHGLCGQGARPVRQALHRRQHHPVRRRLLTGGDRRAHPGQHLRDRERRPGRPRHEGEAGLGPRPEGAAGLCGRRRHQELRRSQGQAAERGRRRRRQLQLAHRPRGARQGRAQGRRTPSSSPRAPPAGWPG